MASKQIYVCKQCGSTFERYPSLTHSYCSRRCNGLARGNSQPKRDKNPNWKGGKTLNSKGYIAVYLPEHNRADQVGYVLEHILIAETVLGKPLPEAAVVHHVNEIKTDNRKENLVICQDARYHALLHYRLNLRMIGVDPDRHARCSRCGLVKTLDAFHKARKRVSGVAGVCRACQKIFDFNKYRRSIA